jgi:hypothetical protein
LPYKTVKCPIAPPEEPYGNFANAFSVSGDGAEALLDFCLFSEAEEQAKVLARVRVSKEFLEVIHQRLGDLLQNRKPNPTLLVLPGTDEIN